MGNIGGLYKWGDAKIWEGINAIYKWLYKPGESAPIPTPGPAPSPKVTPTPPPTATPYSKVTPLPTLTDTSGLEAISKMARDNADAISAANKALAAYYANIGQPPVFPGYRWNGTSPGTPKQYTHAAGIKRVPWDNYPTLLLKGETVLPSGEAGEYRGNGNQAAKVGNIFHLAFHINGGNYDVNQLASIMVGQLKEAALNME
jgi:hypothetical protein